MEPYGSENFKRQSSHNYGSFSKLFLKIPVTVFTKVADKKFENSNFIFFKKIEI